MTETVVDEHVRTELAWLVDAGVFERGFDDAELDALAEQACERTRRDSARATPEAYPPVTECVAAALVERDGAVESLVRLARDDREARAALHRVLETDDDRLWGPLFEALDQCGTSGVDPGDERFERAVLAGLGTGDRLPHGPAVDVAAELAGEEVRPQANDLAETVPEQRLLSAVIDDGSAAVRTGAAALLGEVDTARAATALTEVLATGPDPGVRAAAARALGSHLARGQSADPVQECLVEALVDDEEPQQVREAAFDGLAGMGEDLDPVAVESVPEFVVRRLDPDGRVGMEGPAVAVVGHLDAPGVVDALCEALSADDRVARLRAAQWFTMRPTTEAVGPLWEAVEREDPDDLITRMALVALGGIDHPDATAALNWARDQEDIEVPMLTARANERTIGPFGLDPVGVVLYLGLALYALPRTVGKTLRTAVFGLAPLAALRDCAAGVRNTPVVHLVGVVLWALVGTGGYLLLTTLLG